MSFDLNVQIFTFPSDHINNTFTDIRCMISYTLQEMGNQQ